MNSLLCQECATVGHTLEGEGLPCVSKPGSLCGPPSEKEDGIAIRVEGDWVIGGA